MLRSISSFVFCSLFAFQASAVAQPPEFPGPVKEHQLLAKFVGQWESQSEGTMGPGQPPMKCKGTMSSRQLAGFWVVNELKGDMAGTPMTALQTIGFDPAKKSYIGTWVDSMNHHLWKYEGTYDEAAAILTLEAEGPDFMTGGKSTKFRDSYEFKSADHIVAKASMLGEDGKWITFMTGDIKRQK